MEFRIFTLNCWGIAFVSKNRRARMQAIAEMLANSHYDVVCLQEVWTDADFNLIKEKISGTLPYSHYFYSGVTGSGVCIFSKHVMDEVFFHQWPINGYIHKLHHGDWFGGKGVGLCKLTINGFKINVYSAHLHAEYDRDCDEYKAHRVLQAFDTAQFIELTSGGADLVVLAGDLNTEPGDLAYSVLLSIPGLTDAFTCACKDDQIDIATCESLKNSYTPDHLINKNLPGKRIDYVMYHPGSNINVTLRKYELPLPNRVLNCPYSYSDHEAISSILYIDKIKSYSHTKDEDQKQLVLEQAVVVCNEAMRNLGHHKCLYWFFTFILFSLLIATFVTKAPWDYVVVYHILKVIITLFMVFTMLMATLWNSIERHAVLAGKLVMELSLKHLKTKEINNI